MQIFDKAEKLLPQNIPKNEKGEYLLRKKGHLTTLCNTNSLRIGVRLWNKMEENIKMITNFILFLSTN